MRCLHFETPLEGCIYQLSVWAFRCFWYFGAILEENLNEIRAFNFLPFQFSALGLFLVR